MSFFALKDNTLSKRMLALDEFIKKDNELNHQESVWFSDDDDEEDFRPKVSIMERIRLSDEKERELIRKARERGPFVMPVRSDPVVPVNPVQQCDPEANEDSQEVKELREKCSRRYQEMINERKLEREKAERIRMLQREYQPRDYYWTPDPLFSLHLKQFDYPNIAIDKALFYTDNASAAEAKAYIAKNPNLTELTKSEVRAILFRKFKRELSGLDENKETTSNESEMEVEVGSETLPSSTSSDDTVHHCSPELNQDRTMEAPKEQPVTDPSDNDITSEENTRRGTKRNHAGEATSFAIPSTDAGPSSSAKENDGVSYKMVFLVNSSLLMDLIPLSLEVGKVVANLTSIMKAKTDEFNDIYDKWIKEGSKMIMYKGRNDEHLKETYERMKDLGYVSYLSQCSKFHNLGVPTSTVLGAFERAEKMDILYRYWQIY